MKNNKPDKKQIKTQPLANLPLVCLTEKDMSAVNGGNYASWAG